MKIIVTGSLGNIGKPLTQELVQKGHQVTVISSKPEKRKDIEALGARAAIGSVEDPDFLTTAFIGADAAYCMIPPNHFGEPDPIAYFLRVTNNYGQAIQKSGVKRIVMLSTYGADLDRGTGLIVGAHHAENIFRALPGIDLTILRPTYFYYNLNIFIPLIQSQSIITANYGDKPLVMVSPSDIAAVAAEELTSPAPHDPIRYIASDDRTGNEIARTLGAAIGKPDLKWVLVSDEQMKSNYEAAGLPGHIATGLVEMFESIRNGRMDADYRLHEPKVKGKVKLEDFAREFAKTYHQHATVEA